MIEIDKQFSKWPLKKQSESIEHTGTVSKGKYNLTTKARWKVVGRNKQLDEGTGRQIWKFLDLLNCAALVTFGKHGTWVQTWTWHFWGTLCAKLELLTLVINGIAMAVITQVRMVITSVSLICCASLKGKHNMHVRFQYIYRPTWKNWGARIYCDYTGQCQGLARGIYSLKTWSTSLVKWRYASGAGLGWSGSLKQV